MIIEFFRTEEYTSTYQKYLCTEASHSSHWGVIQRVMKRSQTCQQNAFPINPLSFTVTLFRKYPLQNQTAAIHVENQGTKTETKGVKTPNR